MSVMIMDSSSHFPQPGHLHRMRSVASTHRAAAALAAAAASTTNTTTTTAAATTNSRGAVQKRSAAPRNRTISASQAERLHQLAVDQSRAAAVSQNATLTSQWLTPQPSPQPHVFPTDAHSVDSLPHWTVPTPPRSDTEIPNVTFDSNDIAVTAGITAGDFTQFDPATSPGEMSSLGFLLPSQYGAGNIEAEPNSYTMDPHYHSTAPPPATAAGAAYAQTISSSPALYQSKAIPAPNPAAARRASEISTVSNASNPDPSYGQTYRRPTNSSYDSLSSAEYAVAPNHPVSSMNGIPHNPASSPNLGSGHATSMLPPQYPPSASRSPSLYDTGLYVQPFSTAPPQPTQLYASNAGASYPPPFVGSSVNEVLAKPMGSDSSIRVLNQRPKPQCWEHGCNGRQFSTFSNLLRHQREKSGTAAKSYCPKCGAEFTRTTARNGHLQHDKCTKQRRPSDGK